MTQQQAVVFGWLLIGAFGGAVFGVFVLVIVSALNSIS